MDIWEEVGAVPVVVARGPLFMLLVAMVTVYLVLVAMAVAMVSTPPLLVRTLGKGERNMCKIILKQDSGY